VPTPNEIEILGITKEEKVVDNVLISQRMQISLDYAAHLLNYLLRKDFLTEVSVKNGLVRTLPRYKLTRKGAIALLARLHHIASQYESAVRRTLYLKDVIDEKINEMADYMKETFPENPNLSPERKFEDFAERISRQRKKGKVEC
jgi:predicted ArsR family transcriptional regulator